MRYNFNSHRIHIKLLSNLLAINYNDNKIINNNIFKNNIFKNIHTNINNKKIIDINKKMNNIILKYLKKDCNIPIGSYILLCVSGGLDSMAMLHLLVNINNSLLIPYKLEIINFNHKIRPESNIEV
jgi:tRNA(Ile)-lysidine synthase TilS/MesJ